MIHWQDDCKYIGVTMQDVEKRINQHRRPEKKTNHEVYKKLQSGMPYEIKILETHQDREIALKRERELVCETALKGALLNRQYLNLPASGKPPLKHNQYKKPKRFYPRNERREQKCRNCCQIKGAHEFTSDSGRSCGLASRCRDCYSLYFWFRYWVLKRGGTAKEAYAAFKASAPLQAEKSRNDLYDLFFKKDRLE